MSSSAQIEQQQVLINFRERDFIPAKYVLEMDDKMDAAQTTAGVVRIRLYPAQAPLNLGGFTSFTDLSGEYSTGYGGEAPVASSLDPFRDITSDDGKLRIKVSEGILNKTTEIREKYIFGTSVVNGDTEIALQYQPTSGVDYAIDGRCYDLRGNTIDVHIGYSQEKNALVCSRPFYGVVRFAYYTTYRILRYFPDIYNDFEMYYMPDPRDYGQLIAFQATPPGYEPIPPIVFGVSPPESIVAEFELYRVESYAFAKEGGIWEKPMGWPGDTSYPNSKISLDANESYVEIARTHEIAYFTLRNDEARQGGYASRASGALPLDFSKELYFSGYDDGNVARVKTGSVYGKTADGQKFERFIETDQRMQTKEYFNKYKRMLNNAPRMRTMHYDVPVAEPFNSKTKINEAREVVRMTAVTKTKDAQGNVRTNEVVSESLKTFRIKIVVKAAKRPMITTAVLRNQDNKGATDFDTQAARINTMLSLVWEGVDWRTLKKRIMAAYDPEIYTVTFDSSFPSHN